MARKPRKPGRSPANRNAYERVLIVCEGTKTEPNYFNAVIAILKLTSTDIDLIHSTHTTPMPIAKYTEGKIEKARKDNNPYDHVFCVIDRDRHINFNEASEIMVKNSIKLARSWPCFEYWLLLHFEYTRTDFGETAKETKSDRCIKALEKRIKKESHIPNYTKNYKHFEALMDRLEDAIKNGKKSLKDKKSMPENPTATEVHKVVECLMNIRP